MSWLIRDPADWAKEHGWISRRRARNLADKVRGVADAIEGSLDDDGAAVWISELRKIAAKLDAK